MRGRFPAFVRDCGQLCSWASIASFFCKVKLRICWNLGCRSAYILCRSQSEARGDIFPYGIVYVDGRKEDR